MILSRPATLQLKNDSDSEQHLGQRICMYVTRTDFWEHSELMLWSLRYALALMIHSLSFVRCIKLIIINLDALMMPALIVIPSLSRSYTVTYLQCVSWAEFLISSCTDVMFWFWTVIRRLGEPIARGEANEPQRVDPTDRVQKPHGLKRSSVACFRTFILLP